LMTSFNLLPPGKRVEGKKEKGRKKKGGVGVGDLLISAIPIERWSDRKREKRKFKKERGPALTSISEERVPTYAISLFRGGEGGGGGGQ